MNLFRKTQDSNRKKRRQHHVLDVKVTSDRRAEQNFRILGWILVVCLMLLTIGIFSIKGIRTAANKLFFSNPEYTLRDIVVQGNNQYSSREIIRLANLTSGTNLFSVSLETIKRDLQLVPMIESAEVSRQLPDRLIIQVSERIPKAQIMTFQPSRNKGWIPVVFHMDEKAVVFPPYQGENVERARVYRSLPIITGVPPMEIRTGKVLNIPQAQPTLKFLHELEESPYQNMIRFQRIDVSRKDGMSLVAGSDTTYHLNYDNFAQQLRRLSIIIRDAHRSRRILQNVDLTIAQNIPITYRVETNSVAQSIPGKSSRAREVQR